MRTRLRRTAGTGAGAMLAALAIAACGADDFPNEPRPAAPVELTARITDEQVNVSPREIGAGLVVITVANLSDTATQLTLDGPTSTTSDPIPAGGTGTLKTNLEQGRYSLDVDGLAVPTGRLAVGSPRPSSQNDLLLP